MIWCGGFRKGWEDGPLSWPLLGSVLEDVFLRDEAGSSELGPAQVSRASQD